jgi:hypothetical protein
MKRRRQVLQVSTFPFLAVLLCAMGSLILLLLVIDRRARVVARAKAIQAAARVAEENTKAVEARKAEWERRRRALHALLAQEDERLQDQLKAVDHRVRTSASDVQSERAGLGTLEEHLQSERARLSQARAALAARQKAAAQTDHQSEEARNELRRLTEEVNALEQTLQDLERLRRRDQQTYSLVPYHGRRGENRKPIYVECTAGALIFHPERVVLKGAQVTVAEVLAEVQRQMARQRSASGSTKEAPYLLLLVRPNGITTYYKFLAAVQGLKFDYGYEFVEADWVLDFSENGARSATETWVATPKPDPGAKKPSGMKKRPDLPYGVPSRLGSMVGGGTNGMSGGAHSSEGSSGQTSSAVSREGSGGIDPIRVPSPSTMSAAAGPTSGSSDPFAGGGPSGQPKGLMFGGADSDKGRTGQGAMGVGSVPMDRGPGDPSPGTASSSSNMISEPRPSGSGTAVPLPDGRGSHSPNWTVQEGPGSSAKQPIWGPSKGAAASGSPSPKRGVQSPRGDAVLEPENGGPGQPLASPGSQAVGESGTHTSSGAVNRGSSPASADGSPQSGTSGGSSGSSRRVSGSPNGETPTADGTSRPGTPSRSQPPNQTESVSGNAAGSGFGTGGRTDQSRRPAPTLSSPTVGNRDWMIPIECTADAIIVRTARLRFAASELPTEAGADHPAVQAVAKLIARRQALVRRGEPPYRPFLRFLVQPDGRRTFYRAYPLFERLGIPMVRQNLEREEPKATDKAAR